MSDLNDKVNNTAYEKGPADDGKKNSNPKTKKPFDTEGEYVDYEEIK